MTGRNRPLVLDSFSNLISEGHAKINSTRLLHEILTFEFNSNTNKPEARHGRHDDLIMSMAMGLFIRNNVINELPLGTTEEYDLENEEFEPTFSPEKKSILNIQDNTNNYLNIYQDYNELDQMIIDNDWEQSEEALLREFGW